MRESSLVTGSALLSFVKTSLMLLLDSCLIGINNLSCKCYACLPMVLLYAVCKTPNRGCLIIGLLLRGLPMATRGSHSS